MLLVKVLPQQSLVCPSVTVENGPVKRHWMHVSVSFILYIICCEFSLSVLVLYRCIGVSRFWEKFSWCNWQWYNCPSYPRYPEATCIRNLHKFFCINIWCTRSFHNEYGRWYRYYQLLTNQTSQCWSQAFKSHAQNIATFYLVQATCKRKNLCKSRKRDKHPISFFRSLLAQIFGTVFMTVC